MAEDNKIQPYKPNVLRRVQELSAVARSSSPPAAEGEIDFRYILRVLLNRYRIVLAMGLAGFAAALLISLWMKPVYRSEAMIEIKEATPDIASLQQLQTRNAAPNNVVVTEVETEVGILKSDVLAREVIHQLHLDQKTKGFSLSGLVKLGWSKVSNWWTGSSGASSSVAVASSNASDPWDSQAESSLGPASVQQAKAYELLLNHFEKALTVERVGSSRLVKVSYESDSPLMSSRVVNALVSDYLELHEKSTDRLTHDLADQVNQAKKDLELSETRMQQYARRNGLLYLQTDNGTSQNIVDQSLRQLQQELNQAQADRYQKESVYKLVQKGDYGSLPGVFQDKLLQDLTLQVAGLKTQYAQLSSTFTDKYPKVQQVKNQLNTLERQLAAERRRAAVNITDQYLAAVRREALLVRAVQQQKSAATTVAEKSSQYNILKRNSETDNQLYQDLLQKVKEASLVARIKANNVNVVDHATPEFLPVRPRIVLNLALGLLVGLAFGLGLAFLLERLDTTLKGLDTSLKSLDEVDRFLGVPALAMIPSVNSTPELSGNGHNGQGPLLLDLSDSPSLTKSERPWHRIDKQVHQPFSPLVEAFRNLGSSVMLESAGQKKALRSIVVTSSHPGEGKTTVSVNLAIALAQQGRRVLLIDADMRRPSVHRALGFRNIRGLSGYLKGLGEWAPCVLPGLTPGLDTLPAGKNPQNPVALLTTSRMKVLLGQALEEYEYVIVDSPALMLNLADARILAGLVDGSILVVRSGMVPREIVVRARKHLNNVFGVVLNSMDMGSMDYCYGYAPYGPDEGESEGDDSEATPFPKRIAG